MIPDPSDDNDQRPSQEGCAGRGCVPHLQDVDHPPLGPCVFANEALAGPPQFGIRVALRPLQRCVAPSELGHGDAGAGVFVHAGMALGGRYAVNPYVVRFHA